MAGGVQGSFAFRSWGGRRPGAGRPPAPGRRAVPHRRRAPHDRHVPVHVTFRAAADIPSLRGSRVFAAVRDGLAAASGQTFRLLHWSVQADHLHLLVEAEGATCLARGCQGLAVRVAKAVNRVLGRRGRVWGDRYHARRLGTPSEVRRAFVAARQMSATDTAERHAGMVGSLRSNLGCMRGHVPTDGDARPANRATHGARVRRAPTVGSRRRENPRRNATARRPLRPSRCGDSACTPGGAWRRRRRARGRAGGSDATRASSCCSRDSRGARPSAACRRPHMRAP
jgi:hypothetical protein